MQVKPFLTPLAAFLSGLDMHACIAPAYHARTTRSWPPGLGLGGKSREPVLESKADVADDGRQLRLNLLGGALNKHELGMLIKLLQEKQDELDPLDKAAIAN